MEEFEHLAQKVMQNEPPKKRMPLITTYNSDDEEDELEDIEDNMPLVSCRFPYKPRFIECCLDLHFDIILLEFVCFFCAPI